MYDDIDNTPAEPPLRGGGPRGILILVAVLAAVAVAVALGLLITRSTTDDDSADSSAGPSPSTATDNPTTTTTPSTGTTPEACSIAPLTVRDVSIDLCTDPDAVLVAAAQTIFTYRPAEQSSQADSFRAAGDLLNARYSSEVGPSASALAPITGATWARWAETSSIVTADAAISPTQHPADTETSHMRVVEVTQRIEPGPGGAPEPDQMLTAYMVAGREGPGRPWQVVVIDLR